MGTGTAAVTASSCSIASDGLRQDAVAKYADKGLVPGFRDMLKHGAYASNNGLLTQAPPNTGAGWFTLATGTWPGVHGSTNNTFHINGSTFANSTAAFGATNVLQAESIAQSAERGGKKVAQIEWAGGRSASIDGPTLDFRNFRSVRGVVTNYTSPSDIPANISAFGVQYDKADPAPASGWTDVPRSYSPAKQMHMAVFDTFATGGQDRYGLEAYIYDSSNNGRVDYDRVLFSRTKDGDDKVADLKEGQLADVKVKIVETGALNGKTGAMLVKVERLSRDLSQVRLFHTSVTRAIAIVADLAERAGLHRPASRTSSPSASRPRRPATSPCSRPASSARRPTSTSSSTGRPRTTR